MQSTIVIVEDDHDIREFLEEIFREEKFIVYSASTGISGLRLVEKIKPSIVVLDLGLPDINGETVCLRIKKNQPTMPVIILTASNDSQDLIDSFNKGADDYIKKPFINEELVARVKAKLRKQTIDDPILKVDDLILNKDTLDVTVSGHAVSLTQTEFELLHYLMLNAGRVLSREQILGHVWAQDPDIETRVVDVYIGYLRKKIDKDRDKKLIHSKRGFGYVLKD